MRRIILLLVWLVFILGCQKEVVPEVAPSATEPSPTSVGETGGPPAKSLPAAESVPQKEKKVFPRKSISTYQGIWMPAIYAQGAQSLDKREDLVSIGANTVAFAVDIPFYQSTGELASERVESSKKKAKELIRYYKEGGLAVLFSPEPVVADLEGEPGPIPESVREAFLRNYEPVIIELARISEEEQVEVFSPMNEPDYKLGAGLSSSWGQEILPKIKSVYAGKVMWKGSLTALFSGDKKIDFSGYDQIGFTTFPWAGLGRYREELKQFVDTANQWAAEDGVGEVLIAEFGVYGPVGLAKEDEPKAIEYVFEEGQGKVKGFIVLDPPQGFGTPIKGSALEPLVRARFGMVG